MGVSQSVTNLGTEFWIAIPPNFGGTSSLYLYIASNVVTSGTISSAYPGVNQNFNVNPGVVTQIILPAGVALNSGVENKGIHIVANDPIAVYELNYQMGSTDAYLSLPLNALGTDYRILTYKTTLANNGCTMSVVATTNGTVLNIFNHQTNATTNINLNQGETYHLESPVIGDDLSGSRIQSNFPVAVFAGSDGVNITQGCTYADHIVEQLFPYYSLGKNYVTVPTAGRGNTGDIFRILSADDGNIITINGTAVATINTGEFYETNIIGYSTISTTKASLVAQYAKGTSCVTVAIGDPFMMQIFPVEQFLTDYTIVNVANFADHWVNLVAPDYAINSIYEDGVLIPPAAFTQVGTTNYYGAQRSVTVGSHTYSGNFPFGVFVYGWNNVNSYGYPGGGSLSPVGTVDSVSISPDTSYGELNVTNICLTAHVLNNLNVPVEGVLVNFNISGLGTSVGNAYTNVNGDAQYCYTQTGTIAGEDHIYAEVFGFISDTAVVFWSNAPCSNPLTGGTIGNDQVGCGSYQPTTITNIQLPAGQAGLLEYKWQSSTISASTGFVDIPASNSATFSPGVIPQTTWFKRLARVACMGDWNGSAESNVVVKQVTIPLAVGVAISADGNNLCNGTPVNFNATPTNGGSAPYYQWKVNGGNVGPHGSSFTYTPTNSDIVTCELTSNELCSSGNPALSNSITMTVVPISVVSCSMTVSLNPVCQGGTVNLTALPTNGGTLPSYQWKLNGSNVGSNMPAYSVIPNNNDVVTCTVTSSLQCVTGNPATSTPVTLVVNPNPIVTFTACFDTFTTSSAKPIKLKGGVPLGGVYSGTGISNGYYYPNLAGIGNKIMTYTYTNTYLCSASKNVTIHQLTSAPFTCGNTLTDIRDSRTYSTVLVGSQCWMASNLNFGNPLSSTQHQRDNCVAEKYSHPSSLVPGAYYQWDELMRYDDTPGLQGLCPPAWHVPTEAEWNTLFANWISSGFAGSPLKYDGYSGFNALLGGANFQNRTWSFDSFVTLFWTSTQSSAYKAWSHGMNDYDPSVSLYPSSKSNAFSVRCVKDN